MAGEESPGEVRRENWYLNMGTGPFLAEEMQQDIVTMIRWNPNHWREELPFVDGIEVFVIRDLATTFAALVTGKIDVSGQGSSSMTAGQVAQAQRDFPDRVEIRRFLSTGGRGLRYNLTVPPFDDIRVRKAFSLALDHDEYKLFKMYGSLEGTEIAGVIAPGTFWAHTEEEMLTWPGYRQPKDEDIAEANRLLDEVYGEGIRPEISCMSIGTQHYVDLCLYAADQWAKSLGVTVIMEIEDGAVNAERGRICEYQVQSRLVGRLALVADPEYWLNEAYLSTGAGFNPCLIGYEGQAELDELISLQSIVLDPAERVKLVQIVEHQIVNDAYYGVTLDWLVYFYGTRPEVKGAVFSDYSTYTAHTWLWERVWLDG